MRTVEHSDRTQNPAAWWGRAALVAVVSWWTVRLTTGVADGCFLDLVNLAFHEAGHVFLRPFGNTLHTLGGTLGQLAVPAILAVYFLRFRPQPFGAAFCLWWFGESFVDVAVYMADARDAALPLLGGYHDWNELFFQFGLLHESAVRRISGSTHVLGTLLMLAGLAWMVYFLLPAPWQEAVYGNLPKPLKRLGER